ncbi:MAG: alpha-ketoglutarate-dependent dioxygenase AlkB [Bacteroidota bacterium]
MNGITFIEIFIEEPQEFFLDLRASIDWDERMTARKTASYGVAYNYSQMSYPFHPMLPGLASMSKKIDETIGFEPNNCLINYYMNGLSKMGFHSDQTDILAPDTGVAIISLGETRVLRFRNIADKTIVHDYPLPSGSLIYMTQEVQSEWQHAIPKDDTVNGRMSLTFRKIVA